MPPDSELLRQYLKDGSQAAFAEIVQRHLNMVYSTALRLVGADSHLAEDVTQTVFTDLARHAPRLIFHPTLAGWLHTTAHFAASKTRRAEARRRTREQEAFAMQDHTVTAEIHWEQLRPALDEAVNQLNPRDRDAVLLRYFEGRSHREIGAVLGLQEDAARMRVERALEKLRGDFARRGVRASAAILASVIAGNSVQAAPVGFAARVPGAAVAAGGGSGSSHALRKIFFMSTKIKIALTLATVGAVAAALLFGMSRPANPPAHPATVSPRTTPPKSAPNLSSMVSIGATTGDRIQAAINRSAVHAGPLGGSANPNSETGPDVAVQNNLLRIFDAAQQYMLDKHATEAPYADVVAGGFLAEVTPVAGENYNGIIVHQTDTAISLSVPGLGVITHDSAVAQPPPVNAPVNAPMNPASLVDLDAVTFADGAPVAVKSPSGDPYTITANILPDGSIKLSYTSERVDGDGKIIGKSGGSWTGHSGLPVEIMQLGIKFRPVMDPLEPGADPDVVKWGDVGERKRNLELTVGVPVVITGFGFQQLTFLASAQPNGSIRIDATITDVNGGIVQHGGGVVRSPGEVYQNTDFGVLFNIVVK